MASTPTTTTTPTAPAASRRVGIDFGAQKSVIVVDDGSILRTTTGSIHWPSIVAFQGRARLTSEEAIPYVNSENSISMMSQLLGKSLEEVKASRASRHRKNALSTGSSAAGGDDLCVTVDYNGQQEAFSLPSTLAIYFSNLVERVAKTIGSSESDSPVVDYSVVMPYNYSEKMAQTVVDAFVIAGVSKENLHLVDSSDCITAAYNKKLKSLLPLERAALNGKVVALFDIGNVQTTIVFVKVFETTTSDLSSKGGGGGAAATTSECQKINVVYDSELGGIHFDDLLFSHYSDVCKTSHGSAVVPGSKRGDRLLRGCEGIRKLLSQLSVSSFTVENLSNKNDVNDDVTFTLNRDQLAGIHRDLIERFKGLVRTGIDGLAAVDQNSATATATATSEGDDSSVTPPPASAPPSPPLGKESIAAIEIFGGTSRMPSLQQAILEVVGRSMPLGAKLDDVSIAYGATIAASVPTSLSASEGVEAKRGREMQMRALDQELLVLSDVKNKMESFILEMRSAPNRKHGKSINSSDLSVVLDKWESWMWDNGDDASLAALQENNELLRKEVMEVCKSYFELVEVDRANAEQELVEEEKRAAAEREANGEDEEDRDNRKLKKADRMRLVVMNKEEGNELFKGGNYRNAAARYVKSLDHIKKFFDLSPEDEAEVRAIKVSCNLNIANCYSKMENVDKSLQYTNDALALDKDNAKALYRRATIYTTKKNFDAALIDIVRCEELQKANGTEDKLVAKTADMIRKSIAALKEKEKNMAKKMFG